MKLKNRKKLVFQFSIVISLGLMGGFFTHCGRRADLAADAQGLVAPDAPLANLTDSSEDKQNQNIPSPEDTVITDIPQEKPEIICENQNATNFNQVGSCQVEGCTVSGADNFNQEANVFKKDTCYYTCADLTKKYLANPDQSFLDLCPPIINPLNKLHIVMIDKAEVLKNENEKINIVITPDDSPSMMAFNERLANTFKINEFINRFKSVEATFFLYSSNQNRIVDEIWDVDQNMKSWVLKSPLNYQNNNYAFKLNATNDEIELKAFFDKLSETIKTLTAPTNFNLEQPICTNVRIANDFSSAPEVLNSQIPTVLFIQQGEGPAIGELAYQCPKTTYKIPVVVNKPKYYQVKIASIGVIYSYEINGEVFNKHTYVQYDKNERHYYNPLGATSYDRANPCTYIEKIKPGFTSWLKDQKLNLPSEASKFICSAYKVTSHVQIKKDLSKIDLCNGGEFIFENTQYANIYEYIKKNFPKVHQDNLELGSCLVSEASQDQTFEYVDELFKDNNGSSEFMEKIMIDNLSGRFVSAPSNLHLLISSLDNNLSKINHIEGCASSEMDFIKEVPQLKKIENYAVSKKIHSSWVDICSKDYSKAFDQLISNVINQKAGLIYKLNLSNDVIVDKIEVVYQNGSKLLLNNGSDYQLIQDPVEGLKLKIIDQDLLNIHQNNVADDDAVKFEITLK